MDKFLFEEFEKSEDSKGFDDKDLEMYTIDGMLKKANKTINNEHI